MAKIALLCVLSVASFAGKVDCATKYMLKRLVDNYGMSSFQAQNESSCSALCNDSSSVSAVSYSKRLSTCKISTCGNLQLVNDAQWVTYVCGDPFQVCSLPTPMFDWQMTDSCGFGNNGFLYPTLSMVPPSTYTTTPTASRFLGNSVLYPSNVGYFSAAKQSSISLNFNDKATFFGYFKSTSQYPFFPLLEIGSYDGTKYAPIYQVQIISNYHRQNFYQYLQCTQSYCPSSCFFVFQSVDDLSELVWFAINPGQWYWFAVVYKGGYTNQITVFINGYQVDTISLYDISTSSSIDTIITGGWPSATYSKTYTIDSILPVAGNYSGSTYCLKVFDLTLESSDLSNLAASCLRGTINLL